MDSVYDKLGSFGQWLLTYPFALLTVGLVTVLLILVITAIRESYTVEESSILGADGYPLISPPRISKTWSTGFSIVILICISFITYGAHEYYLVSPMALLRRYPLGYVFFNGDYETGVFPYATRNQLKEYTFDWRVVKITENTPNVVMFQIPDVYENGQRIMRSNYVRVRKQAGELGNFVFSSDADKVAMVIEILNIKKESVIFLIGFRELPSHP